MEIKFNSLEGKILVASPKVIDKFFEKSLIYIFLHDNNGVLGIRINREIGSVSNIDLLKMLDKETNKIKNRRLPVMFGGPVNTETIIALSMDKQQKKDLPSMQSVVLYTDIQKFAKDFVVKNNKSKILLAKGISAWDSDQLEDEIADNSWFVIQPKVEFIFSHDLKNKWLSAMEQLGISDMSFVAPYSGRV